MKEGIGTMETSPLSNHRRRRSLTGPLFLITLGAILLIDQIVPSWGFWKTWPILLVLIGVTKLLDASQPPRPPEGPRV